VDYRNESSKVITGVASHPQMAFFFFFFLLFLFFRKNMNILDFSQAKKLHETHVTSKLSKKTEFANGIAKYSHIAKKKKKKKEKLLENILSIFKRSKLIE
jgi:hypothetical protein